MYDGDDLDAVAAELGLAVDDVIARHVAGTYVADFCGFAPGFAYLSGLDPTLRLPRRATPRTSVPAGSVAIAGPYTAVYPTASPGGWHLLGHTDIELFDPSVDPPALLAPGTRVTFRRSGRPTARIPGRRPPRTRNEAVAAQIAVVRAGISTTFQDRGRPGYAHLAVPQSGALDRERADLVNRLVGNRGDEAVLETAGGLVLRAIEPVVVADSTSGAVRAIPAGERITVDPRDDGLYAYVAVRGGFDVEPVLGSRSWDSLSKLGPPPPEPGDQLIVGPDPRTELVTDLAPPPAAERALAAHVWRGPRPDWFAGDAFGELLSVRWTVSADVSRVGIRLSGPPLKRHHERAGSELPSEGLVTGAVQVPPDGQPVIMLNDHPTTGGYPVIGVVDDRGIGLLAQARPGAELVLREVTG